MPMIYVKDDVFSKFVEKYGYDGAKKKIIEVLEDNAPGAGK